jgi:lipoprotein NlpD
VPPLPGGEDDDVHALSSLDRDETVQAAATLGEGPERKPRLHFEIRRNGKPVNPQQFLPAR